MEFYVSTLGKRTSKTCCPSQKRRRKSTNEFKQVSPMDGTVLRFGELKESRGMIEQVKGHSYSAPGKDESEEEAVADKIDKSWLRFSLASPKLRESISASPMKGIYYCVIYLRPGDYHRIHSPADWNALVRRHFAGRLFPVNECATRTIKNLYVENEMVVLEGIWKQGFMALAADGATNIGSIQVYDPQGHGVKLEKGKGVGVFNMGSTVAVQTVPQITDSVLIAVECWSYLDALKNSLARNASFMIQVKPYNFTPNHGTFTYNVESSNTTPQAAWQIAQPPASGTNPMDGATKGMDVDQPTPPSFGDEEKSL
uniref:phosphatidylserine decarboxylase n=1 Tax=Brassica oleracea var. oleracea TaxID=109376 RepID=A0A0D3AN91_BRAOL